MKIGIFSPYLDTLGGGERYMMTIAEFLSGEGHQVNIFWDDPSVKNKIRERLGIDLSRVNFVEDIFYPKNNLFIRFKNTRKYDLIFVLSDGSIPFLFAKKNILHFQVPFKGVEGKSVLNKLKLTKFNRIICNSSFTKKYVDQEYGVTSQVIYPPVAVEEFKPGKKENLILSVGHFTKSVDYQKGLIRPLHSKKQDILIEVFKQMYDQGLKNWQLILAGGALKEDESYVSALKKSASGYPIEIRTNINFAELKKYYARAKIFWHATGFGEDEVKHPERMEHFGIVVVEAMATGCVPVVINKGGLPEIVTHGANGLLWNTRSDLVKATLSAIGGQAIKSQTLWQKLSLQSIKSSRKFSKKVFCQKIDEIIKS